MNFELADEFTYDDNLAEDLIDNKSPIRPLPEQMFLLGRICWIWPVRNRDWPVIRYEGEGEEMSFRYVLKVPKLTDLDFNFYEAKEGMGPFLVQTAPTVDKIRNDVAPQAGDVGASSSAVIVKSVANVVSPKGSGPIIRESYPVAENLDDDLPSEKLIKN
ncbi:hypothetical protein HanPI659440_Chr12g0466681 [Helianthus annuus]|nr:hypothetical protein HanPI659440_Chr12g0466681 [Helianthus annuus]